MSTESLECTIEKTKNIISGETWNYKGSTKNLVKNGALALAGIGLALYLDSWVLEMVCGAYGTIKAVQFAKDVREYKRTKKVD